MQPSLRCFVEDMSTSEGVSPREAEDIYSWVWISEAPASPLMKSMIRTYSFTFYLGLSCVRGPGGCRLQVYRCECCMASRYFMASDHYYSSLTVSFIATAMF